jgi:hypothetical protein
VPRDPEKVGRTFTLIRGNAVLVRWCKDMLSLSDIDICMYRPATAATSNTNALSRTCTGFGTHLYPRCPLQRNMHTMKHETLRNCDLNRNTFRYILYLYPSLNIPVN